MSFDDTGTGVVAPPWDELWAATPGGVPAATLDGGPLPPSVLDRVTWQRGATTWLAIHIRSVITLSGVLLVAGYALAIGIAHYPAFSDDEGTYVAQAWAVRSRWTLAHYTYWYDHPPLGWLQLALLTVVLHPLAAVAGVAGSAVTEARFVMLLPALTTTALVYLLLRRVGSGRLASALGAGAFALCPLTVSNLRQVYLDGLALPWIVGGFVLVATPRRRLWAYAGAGTCAAMAVLSKETMIVAVPALGLAVWQGSDRRTRAFCISAFAAPFALVVLGYPLFALLKGELLPGSGHVSLYEALRFQLAGRDSTGSALDPSSASHQLMRSWLALDPWLLGVGAAAVPIGVVVRRLRPPTVAFVSFVLVGVRPGYLPQPYVIALLPFAAVTGAGAASWLWPRLVAWLDGLHAPRLQGALIVTLVLAVVVPVCLIGPAWSAADRGARSLDLTSSTVTATRWVVDNVDHRARILVDDTFFVDLAASGFEPGLGVVWFYKMDFTTNLDPSVTRALPHGYRDFDYVVSTPVIRSALEHNPGRLDEVRRALDSSVVVAGFGDGATLVEVRRIVGPGTGSGRLDQATSNG